MDIAASYRSLAPPIDVDGPRVRLGVLWWAVTMTAAILGAAALAVTFAAVALAAAGQACAAWTREQPVRRRPFRPVAIGGAVLIALAAARGPTGFVAAAIVAGVASHVLRDARVANGRYDAALTAAIALGVGCAAGVVPVVRDRFGFSAAVVLVLAVQFADASVFVVGSGARHRWEAPIAATATVMVLALFASSTMAPPFRGASAFVLAAVTALLAPLGARVASALLPSPTSFAPALRRLDSLLVAGPVWAVVAAVVLDVR